MTWVGKSFCRNRAQMLRGSLLLAAVAPFVAILINGVFGVDARAVLVTIAAVLFAVWRPYRDSWLRAVCRVRPSETCA